MLKVIASAALILAVVALVASHAVSQPLFDATFEDHPQQIADPNEALTYARTEEALIWVQAHGGDHVEGIDLTAIYGSKVTDDLFDFAPSFDPATPLIDGIRSERFLLTDLKKPVDYSYPHIAAGTNFKEHAEEVYSDDPPFLFPKLAAASDWRSGVPFTARLDFEAELCVFPLADIENPEDLPAFGLVLCNDFTDRLTLVDELSLSEPLGRTGFASAKGCSGCLPTGYLAVIPRSPDFYLSLELSLHVNEQLRQRFSMSDIILPVEEIVADALKAPDKVYLKGEEPVALLRNRRIPRGTLILTGTAAGVLFRPLNIWNQSHYLQPGDVVRTEATFLGHLENQIQPAG